MVSLQNGVRRATALLVVLAALPLVGCDDSVDAAAANSSSNATSTSSGGGTNTGAASLILVGAPATEATSGVDYIFQPLVSGSNGTVVFTIIGKPSWLSFDANTGALSGRPTDAQVGSGADITITATAASVSGSIGPFRITVTAARTSTTPPAPTNTAPTISGTPAATAVLNQAYNFTPVASDAEGNTLSFSIVNRPAWASFDTATGRLSGTPAAGSEGSYANILVRVSDGNLTVALPAFSIAVSAATSNANAASSNTAPSISGIPAIAVSAGVQYSFTPSASDANGDTLVYSVQNLPAWATFSSANGRIQGTPQSADAGSFANIVVSVSDGRASSTLPAFKITVSGTAGNFSAVLSWSEPRQNVDGTTLIDLGGYHISWGTDPNNLPNTMDLPGPAISGCRPPT